MCHVKVFRLYAIIISTMYAAAQSAFAESELLKSFRWEHRIILVQALFEEESSIIAKLETSNAAIDTRHILWFLVGGDFLYTNYEGFLPGGFADNASKVYFSKRDETVVFLFGKDGELKARQADLDLEVLFRQIDSMPMRRLEMLGETGGQ